MRRTNALRALSNLCAFIGAIVLFSYFYNWAVDLRHWYVTLASAIMCAILWFGFYVIEARGGLTQVTARAAVLWANLRNKSAELPAPSGNPAAEHPPLPDPSTALSRAAEPEVTAPRSATLPWLRPHS